MTKKLFKLTSAKGHSNLPPIQNRRFGNIPNHLHYAARAYKGDGDDDAEAILDKIEKRTAKQLAVYAEKSEVEKISLQLRSLLEGVEAKDGNPAIAGVSIECLRSLADEKTGALSKLVSQGLEIQKLKNNLDALPADMSLRAQIVGWKEKNKDAILAIREGGSQVLPAPFKVNLSVRAVASPMLPSTFMPNGSTFITKFGVEAGMNEVLRIEPTFWDYLTKSKTGLETYIWVNKVPTEGGAEFIAAGVHKPGISFASVAETSNAKKIADSVKFATELLDDIDGFEAYVREELMYAVMTKASDVLFNSVGSSTAPKGLSNYGVAYNSTFTGVKTTSPNRYDCIAAAVTQLRKQFYKGRIVAFVNTTDETNMNLTKAINQGQLLMPPSTGAVIVAEERVPIGTVIVAAIDYYRIKIYKDFEVKFGWENDDFTKNLITGIGEMRVHQFVSGNYINFAIKDTFANIKTLITEA